MSDLGRLLELLHGAARGHGSVRASLCRGKRIFRQQAPAPAAADQAFSARLSSAEGLLRYAHVELASRLWIVRPDLVRYEREVTRADRAQRPLIVGTAARHSYYDPGVGARSVEDPLVRGELPELHLFDPWEFVCDLELEVAGMTSCAGRQAIEAKATIRDFQLADRCNLFPGTGGEEYLLEVDAERGVILKLTAVAAGHAIETIEVQEIAFDEQLDAQLFVLDEPSEPLPDRESKPVALRCSFCLKSQLELGNLIAGPGIYICSECVELCNEIIGERGATG